VAERGNEAPLNQPAEIFFNIGLNLDPVLAVVQWIAHAQSALIPPAQPNPN
jgi:hypothetical protein